MLISSELETPIMPGSGRDFVLYNVATSTLELDYIGSHLGAILCQAPEENGKDLMNFCPLYEDIDYETTAYRSLIFTEGVELFYTLRCPDECADTDNRIFGINIIINHYRY